MASTYSSRLRLEQQGAGENPNTWGDLLNQNVIQLADDAIASYTTIAVASGETTLSSSSGSTDEARSAALEIKGTLVADVTVVIPASEKTYFIRENTTGSFATYIKAAGGTAIQVGQGTNIYIASDGVNIHKVGGETSVSAYTVNTLEVINSAVFSGTVSVAAIAVTGIVSAASGEFSGNVTANSFIGSGSSLTGITGVPTGTLLPYGGATAPSGYLLCYGQTVSRTTYSDLFTAFSTTYGAGDGSTTFELPDLRGRLVAGKDDMGSVSANRLTNLSGGIDGDVLGDTGGSESHTLLAAESGVPEHEHAYNKVVTNTSSGAIGDAGFAANQPSSQYTSSNTAEDAASAHNNVQPTIILNYIVKT
jgi:microcystin-dependent protein